MLKVDGSVPKIILQFSFSSAKAIPGWVGRRENETLEERTERKSRSDGKLVIELTHNCSILGFIQDLGVAGYELVDAFCQKRINPKYPKNKKYQMVRFVFVRKENMKLPDGFMGERIPALGSLREMCAIAMWRVRAFLNPYYENGEEIPDKRAISINLEGRQPLRTSEGPPIMVWPRDENGRSMKNVPGVEKGALMPRYRLRIKDDVISLIEV